jgi:hypothetical protein
MRRLASSPRDAAGARGRDGREIGPIGTASRVVGGLLAIALPVALSGFGWWDAAAALVVFPLVATVGAALISVGYGRFAPGLLASRHAICSAPGCSLILIVAAASSALDALTPVRGAVALWVWLGASMLLAAARGYGGCEILAISNMITGRRDQIGCILYTPIDAAEARRRKNMAERSLAGRTAG